MIIERVINNNIISTFDGDTEIVISGKGIGFGRHHGDTVDLDRVEKIFRIDNKEQLGRFKDLLTNMPLDYLKIADEIITLAKQRLNVELNQNIYVTLTDHINFALERYDKGMNFENVLTQEVNDFYPNEFQIGLEAVKMIRERTGKDLKKDEAASIAMHIVSAELNTRTSVAYSLTQMVRQILSIVEQHVDPQDETTAARLEEMVPHFKHFAFRVITDQQYTDEDYELYDFIQLHYPSVFKCCQQIERYVKEKLNKSLKIEEKNHLVLMLKRLKFKK